MDAHDFLRILPVAAVYIAATCAVYAIGRVIFLIDRRAARRLQGLSLEDEKKERKSRTPEGLASLLNFSGKKKRDPIAPVTPQPEPAAIPVLRSNDLGWQCGMGAVCLTIGAFFYFCGALSLLKAFFFSTFGIGIAIALPYLVVKRRVENRRTRLRKSLPDFLDLMVACIEAGQSVHAALREVTNELADAHPELTDELCISLGEMELGRSLDDSLVNLAERTQIEELRTLSAFVRHAQQFGSTMADALRQLSDMLRSQRELKAEEMAQKAGAKILIPTLVFIFPTIFIVLAGPAVIKIQKGLQNSIPVDQVASR